MRNRRGRTMKKALLMQGVSGSGKSTFVKGLVDNHRQGNHAASCVVCSADDYFGEDYAFDPAKLGEVHAACLKKFVGGVMAGVELVIVDNTNCSTIELAPYVSLAQAFGYEVEIVRIARDLSDALDRAGNGPHHTPAKAVQGQWRALKNFDPPPWWPKARVVHLGCVYCGSLAPLEGENWECPDCGGV